MPDPDLSLASSPPTPRESEPDDQLRAGTGLAGRRRAQALFRAYPRQYWLMVVGMLISNAGGSLIWPYLLIFVSGRLDLPLTVVGSLITIQAATGMLASFIAGTLADRLGRKVVMALSLGSNGLIYLAMLGAHGYLEFAVLLALFGISNPLYHVGADAMLADLVPSEQRTQAFSINRIAANAGFALGPAIGGFLAATSYSLAFYGAATGFFAYAVLVALRFRETLPAAGVDPEGQADPATRIPAGAAIPRTRRPPHPSRGYGVLLRDRRFVAFTGLVSVGLIAPSAVWILLAVYTKANFGLPEYLYGWIPTVNAVMCVVVQYPVSSITRRFPALPVISVGMLIYALGAGSVALMSSFPGFVASMVVLTIGELVVVPVASKYVADLAPVDLRGRYMSIYWLGWAASRAAAPIVGGFLNDQVAPIAIWYGALAIGLASTAGLALLALRAERVPKAAAHSMPPAV
jgi:MFS family permease